MSNTPRDDQISERIRAHLDDSLQDYDAATLSRLNQARQHALDALPERATPRWQWPAVGLASALALVLVFGMQRNQPTMTPGNPDAAMMSAQLSEDELALLASDDDLEMFQDLEFYAWLEQQQDWDASSS